MPSVIRDAVSGSGVENVWINGGMRLTVDNPWISWRLYQA